MSLGLHLTALESERVMPAIARPKTEISSLANGLNLRKQNDSPNEIHRMKEFSLISHIESLKATAYGELPPSNESPKNTQDLDLPHISRVCHLEHSPSSPSKWALDPGSVEGNLRVHSRNKQVSCTLEDFVSRTSSFAKGSDLVDDDDVEKTSNKSRKKSAKGSKKKSTKRRESRSSIQLEKDPKHSMSPSVVSDLKKKRASANDLPSCDLTVLTALCKRIQIHHKTPNSISVKDAPYQKKSTPVISNIHRKAVSPARASLSNAMIEYNKKHSSVSDPIQRRKQSNSAEESAKTKIFLSEKQSGIISDCGSSFPCAPPATPTTDQLKRIEYVPSLQDIRSQRSIRHRLQIMESKAFKKEKKKQADVEKIEKLTLREKRIEKKKIQRQEIYALNKLMTDWEHERFKQFMAQAGSNI